MTIKSLLLGSAAALVAVSGARAADAIIAEPEPVEYVRVCDMYGAGWFYIPGTETCLRIGGYVWYQVGATNQDALGTNNYFGYAPDGWTKSVRARLNVDARNETEWGTLRSRIRLQSSWNGVGDGNTAADQAWFRLGNSFQFTAGYSESFWANSMNGGASNWGSHSWGGMYYGYNQGALMAFSYVGDNIEVAVSLEDDNFGNSNPTPNPNLAIPLFVNTDRADYVPDVVAKVAYFDSWGAIWARVGYDASFDGSANLFNVLTSGVTNSGGFGAQLGMQFNIPNSPGSSFRLIGYYSDGDHRYGSGAPGVNVAGIGNVLGTSEWSVLGSYNHAFSSTISASVAFQYFSDLYWSGTDVSSGYDALGAELSIVWTPITNFEIRTEIHYDDVDAPSGLVDPDGTISGFLRFTRYF